MHAMYRVQFFRVTRSWYRFFLDLGVTCPYGSDLRGIKEQAICANKSALMALLSTPPPTSSQNAIYIQRETSQPPVLRSPGKSRSHHKQKADLDVWSDDDNNIIRECQVEVL
jgi:hypothetical protein